MYLQTATMHNNSFFNLEEDEILLTRFGVTDGAGAGIFARTRALTELPLACCMTAPFSPSCKGSLRLLAMFVQQSGLLLGSLPRSCGETV